MGSNHTEVRMLIRRVEAAGYHRVPVDKLIEMRIFNIEPETVKALDDGEK
jgi:hypothetical protein